MLLSIATHNKLAKLTKQMKTFVNKHYIDNRHNISDMKPPTLTPTNYNPLYVHPLSSKPMILRYTNDAPPDIDYNAKLPASLYRGVTFIDHNEIMESVKTHLETNLKSRLLVNSEPISNLNRRVYVAYCQTNFEGPFDSLGEIRLYHVDDMKKLSKLTGLVHFYVSKM